VEGSNSHLPRKYSPLSVLLTNPHFTISLILRLMVALLAAGTPS